MIDSQRLEHGYRRILALYPRAFRRESEEEIVAVLMATARDGQRRVGPAEAADLIRGAVRMHKGPRLPRPLLVAVRLTYAGAAAELAVLTTGLPAAPDAMAPVAPAVPAEPKDLVRIDCGSASTKRDGRWVVPNRMEVRVRSGSVKLDFTEAVITGPTLKIDADVHSG